MKINNNEFKKMLDVAGKGINKNSSMAAELQCIELKVFTVKNKKMLLLVSSNNQQNIIQTTELSDNLSAEPENWNALLNYSLLSSLISKLSKDETEIIKDDNKVIIKNGRNKSEVLIQGGEMPMIKIGDTSSIMEISCDEWDKYFKKVTYAIANDDTRPVLRCVFLNNENCLNTDIVALDGFRLAKSTVSSDKKINCVIDGNTIKSVTEIVNKMDSDVKVLKGDNVIIFTIGNCSIISTLINEPFIKYESIIPSTDEMNKITISKEDFLHALERAKIGCSKNTPLVKLKISKNNKMEISSNSEITKMNEELDVISDCDIEIAFNITYLLDSLKSFEEDKIDIFLRDNLSPGIIKNDYLLSLILPVRVMS